ncbi:WxL domain-containing protein [uncultured Enterococcus sp.]|uniref:WxL domain-containing protein n=1 Tax=uncultured Enterococcus sp. TaxID=167972 RepID=UPI002AA7EC6D|nr:WxL domain-containing protein [uncultured Enterococcus sp.]
MKHTHKLAGALLLAAVGIGLAVPSATKATSEHAGKGHINFNQSGGVPDVGGSDAYKPGESTDPITEPTNNPDRGALRIANVSDLEFDTHQIITDENAVKTYDAKAFETTYVESGAATTTTNFIRFMDADAGVAQNHHTVSAMITSQFTNGTTTLSGSTITYKNIHLVTGTNPTTMPDVTNASVTLPNTSEINETAKQVVYTNKQAGKGFGTFELTFGDLADQTTWDKSVTLTIPSDLTIRTGDYNAEVTWYIERAN